MGDAGVMPTERERPEQCPAAHTSIHPSDLGENHMTNYINQLRASAPLLSYYAVVFGAILVAGGRA